MFFHRTLKIDKKMIPNLRPTSKTSLKQICLITAEGDLEKAQKLYDYMSKDLDDLPLFDEPIPSTFQQVKTGIGETMQWVNQNQETIFVWLDVLRNFFGNKNNKGGGVPPSAVAQAASPIPTIN